MTAMTAFLARRAEWALVMVSLLLLSGLLALFSAWTKGSEQ